MQTTVKWFNESKGYGFLDNGTGPDIYVNAKSLHGLQHLQTGDIVEFECHVFDDKLVAREVRSPQGQARETGNYSGNTPSFGNRSHYNRHGYPPRVQQPNFVMR